MNTFIVDSRTKNKMIVKKLLSNQKQHKFLLSLLLICFAAPFFVGLLAYFNEPNKEIAMQITLIMGSFFIFLGIILLLASLSVCTPDMAKLKDETITIELDYIQYQRSVRSGYNGRIYVITERIYYADLLKIDTNRDDETYIKCKGTESFNGPKNSIPERKRTTHTHHISIPDYFNDNGLVKETLEYEFRKLNQQNN